MKNNGKITNKLIIILIVVASIFAIYIKANAASTVGSASIGYTVNNNANIGDEITVKVNVNNVNVDSSNIGICGVGGNISFDSDYLEFISATGMSSPYAVSVNKNNNYKFAGIDFTLSNGFSSATDIITLKFKTLKAGSTTLSLANVLLNDCNNNKLSVTPVSKTITIGTPVIKDSNNYLSSLSVTGYTISPAFNKNTTSYSLTVPNDVSSVTVNATKESAKATLTGTGNKNLSVGANNISVVVTAENGNKRTYTITVTRQSAIQKSSDNSLKDLSVPGYTLSPAFSKDNLDYTLKVPNDATKIDVKAITNNEKSSVKVVGNTDLKVGENVVTVEVTAEDGSKKTYKITVTREEEKKNEPVLDSDATLSKLNVGGYILSPAFNKNKFSYSITVPSNVDNLTVQAIASSSKAKVTISGNSNLKPGMNYITVTVTAENGNKNTYTVNVTKKKASTSTSSNSGTKEEQKKSNENYLESLVIGNGEISPKFDKNMSNYEVTVPYESNKLDLTYKASDKAKVEVMGNKDLKVGEITPITIKVIAEDGSVRIYTLNVKRSPLKSNNDLSDIKVDGKKLDENFDPDNLNYKLTVDGNTDSLDVEAITKNPNAKVEITGNKDLKVGETTAVTIKVTAEDGSVRIYTLNVKRSPLKSNNDLSDIKIDGKKLDDNFDPDNLNYKLTVDGNTDSLDVEAIAKNPNAKVEITGNKNLKEGNNVVMVRVTDENGFTKSYQIDVEKKSKKILGLTLGQFFALLSLLLLLLAIIIMLIILIKRKNKNKEDIQKISEGTKIEFKPEINIGSRNGTDDDTIYPNGNLYQDSKLSAEVPKQISEPKNVIDSDSIDADYEEKYDLYDDVVTKDELYDALEESLETNNTDKLKMLLKQEEVNRLKKEIKEKQEKLNKSSRYDTFDDDDF